MVETPGVCTQTSDCEVARSGRLITVPLGSPFICPECECRLSPPVQSTDTLPVQKMPASVPLSLMGAGLLVLGGAVFLGRELGEGRMALAAQAGRGSQEAVSVPMPPLAPARLAAAAPALLPAPLQPARATDPKVAQAGDPAPSIADTRQTAAAPPVTITATTGSAFTVATRPAPEMATAAPPAPAAAQLAKPPLFSPPAAAVVAAAVTAPPAPALPDQGFSPVPISGGSPAYPAALAADGRPGRVNASCQISADGSPSGCHATASKGGPEFAAATLAWLAHAHVRFRPTILHGHPVAVSRSWTLAIEEPAAMLAEATRKQQEIARAEAASREVAVAAPEPAPQPAPAISLPVQPIIARQVISAAPRSVIERPFSSHVIAGGAPVFPGAYDESRPGAVKVQCTIKEDGAPSLCHILKTVGGSAFGKSVETWLGSGRVRFRPVLSRGQPVVSEQSWTVVFNSLPVPQ